MSAPDPSAGDILVVAEDGSIPAEQLARLCLLPGTHLRVVEAHLTDQPSQLAGALPDFPDLDWSDFERGSALAVEDLNRQ